MAKTVKVAFEIDAEEVKKIIAADKRKTKPLRPKDVDRYIKEGVIKASDLLTKPIAEGVVSIFAKMQQYPDQSSTVVPKLVKQFQIPKEDVRYLVQQHVMFHAGMLSIQAEKRVASRRKK